MSRFKKAWDEIQNMINNFIRNMPKKVDECIRLCGVSTKILFLFDISLMKI